VTPLYFDGIANHDIIICDEKGLGLKERALEICHMTHSAKSLKLMSPE